MKMDTVERIGNTLVLMGPDGEVLAVHCIGSRRRAKRIVLGWIARHTVRYTQAMRLI